MSKCVSDQTDFLEFYRLADTDKAHLLGLFDTIVELGWGCFSALDCEPQAFINRAASN